MADTLAFVGVAGGVGTTRTVVETAATLARDGHSVAVLDAALGTQGLSTYVEGRLDPDLTAVLVEETGFSEAAIPGWPELDGEVALYPAHAPFERLARAKTVDAAQRLETCIDHAAGQYDHVLLDVPPVADNQAVAAVRGADQRALVAPATRRGNDHLPRMRGRLVDLGFDADAVVGTFADGETALSADYELPAAERGVTEPTAIDPDTEFAPAVATMTEALCRCSLDLDFPEEGLLS
ncbi:ParA family protein [Halomicrobium sp. IBSBa]|uniref:ParA family protein n=1 Tax=Halomicrobium sp. IBSBa TaxID=2778916 RepID=UPI001ABEF266|nr:ParA family protein [Halomicrobium sp. IBSBa]MBO4247862.1 ParA family protein [Halomicrobium sp. IBSBa]